jgi:hypothetical protein
MTSFEYLSAAKTSKMLQWVATTNAKCCRLQAQVLQVRDSSAESEDMCCLSAVHVT